MVLGIRLAAAEALKKISGAKEIRASDAKEVGVENPAEERSAARINMSSTHPTLELNPKGA